MKAKLIDFHSAKEWLKRRPLKELISRLHIIHKWSKWQHVGTHDRYFYYGLQENEEPYRIMPIRTFQKTCDICGIEKFKEVKTG